MEKREYKESAINEKINRLEKTQVIKNYYLVLGGGKIGTDFLQYARKNKFPFVLIIDRDENAPATSDAEIIKTEDDLVNLLKIKASAPFHAEAPKSPGAAGENEREYEGESKRESIESKAYFYKMDLDNIPFLLSLGIPEYIIPAVPCHAVAYMLSGLLKLPPEPGKNEKPEEAQGKIQKGNNPVTELLIKPEDERLISFFEKLAASFPEAVITGRYPEYGMLFFSYAREGEICPDGCPGPEDRCPTFGRKKPETITEYTRELRRNLPGWIFESHQMKPGTGGLKGRELRQNLLEILEFLNEFNATAGRGRFENIEDRTFFIATTCTCHGVLNLFYIT
ncbi:hypothetical protein EQO05_14145 [Methanosarcina sp. MSH10X1]|uniref:hypothetical protein n=1 Tax=Methanosarcina sp. MSH10X1 TaxID=2507075 RepID=UPI000FFB16DF|nr:hypothetical protein [Methanosarcina sp. MSH10X1]RXA16386.1 hypothetical protein EQO05_14145 [Methanosarcina sp. MSH10X1]